MAQKTILKIVQDTLSAMDSDEVNSISDTVESEQVADHLVKEYYLFITEFEVPLHKKPTNLTGLGNLDKPTHVLIPDNVREITHIKYDARDSVSAKKSFKDLIWKHPTDFIGILHGRDSTSSSVKIVQDFNDNMELFIRNDTHPTYWSTLDDRYIIFDAYKSSVDSTIQESKIFSFGVIEPNLTLADSTVVDLPNQLFPLFEERVLARAMYYVKQTVDQKAEKNIRALTTKLNRGRYNVEKPRVSGVNYGRPKAY